MRAILQIDQQFIETHTDYPDLIMAIKDAFDSQTIIVPSRHHHDFPNPKVKEDTTLLLMPAWNPGKNAGVKMVTINPKNGQFNLPAIQGSYLYFDAVTGEIKAIFEAKSLTVMRTAATSALASSFLSKTSSSSLLMIGTGALAKELIKAHCAIRPIQKVFIWGRNNEKAIALKSELSSENYQIETINNIDEKISEVDIISCATLSKTPLVLGQYIRKGQHIDLVGAYKPTMREGNDDLIKKAQVYLDTFDGGLKESGDIVIPIENGSINEADIKADLFQLSNGTKSGRKNDDEITLFKSVGHALEDLAAATYYFNQL